MRFPPSFIERLRSHFLMSEIISRRMPLKKHGREFQGLCPFHNEKTPSFTVNDEKGFYHCFGCGAHGDAIEFVRKFERLSYPETVETLAREAGIPLPTPSFEDTRRAEVEKTLQGVLESACHWFERQLSSSSGITARDYLEKRGLKPETMRSFRIGYAPDERTSLHQHLLKEGFPQNLQAEAGLIIVPETGGPYDRFRGRVIFPIRNPSGKVIAFGGRLIIASPNKNLPKYLNSPETPLFKKGEVLYNLDVAKRPARDANLAVVMEGYMDVVSTAQAGVTYAMATLGTAVTAEHLRLLWQLAREPVMCLDGDAAGQRAMLRAAETALPLLKPGYSLRFAVLPKGEDPDSYVQKYGRTAFEKILMTAPRLSQVLWEHLRAQGGNLAEPEDFATLKDVCTRTAKAIADPVVRNEYMLHFDRHLYASKQQLNKKLREGKAPRARQVAEMMAQDALTPCDRLVQRLLRLILSFPQLLHHDHRDETLSQIEIRDSRLDALRHGLLACTDSGDREVFLEQLRAQVGDDILEAVMRDNMKLPYRETVSEDEAKLRWADTLSAYQVAHLEHELHELQAHMGSQMDEASYRRLTELKQALWKAQKARTFAPAETDAI